MVDFSSSITVISVSSCERDKGVKVLCLSSKEENC